MKWWPPRKRIERLLADAAAMEDAVARAQAAPRRAYTKTGKLAHLLDADGFALCPNMSAWGGSVWLGASPDSSDEERARAAVLPACKACEQAAGKVAS